MKYIRLFEQFEEGHKFDILDLHLMDSSYVKSMFFKEIQKLNYDLEKIQTILDSGLVNIDDADYWGNTALIYATKSYNLELIKFLISNGADPNASNSIDLLSPLHEAAYSGFVKAVQFLISSGANPNVKDRKQWTPLHLAAQRTDKNHMEIVEILIESGADLYAKTTSNITPLDLVNSEEMQNVFEKYKKKEAHSQI